MIYYTADLHFGYDAILSQASRPFACVEDMDRTLIDSWNSTVSDADTVYLVGDIGSYRTPLPAEQLSRLRGRKHLIRGNHDTGLENQRQLFDYFETVTDFLEIDDGPFHITLCHYPIVYIQNGYMIHGHLHNTKKEIYNILRQLPRVMNACTDINHFRPVTLDELIRNNQSYYHDPTRGKHPVSGEIPEPHKQKWKATFHRLPTK